MWSWIRRIFGKASLVTAGGPPVPVVSEPASPVVLPPLAAITPPAAVIEPRYTICVEHDDKQSKVTLEGPLPSELAHHLVAAVGRGAYTCALSPVTVNTGEKGTIVWTWRQGFEHYSNLAIETILKVLDSYWSERQVPHEIEEIRRITAAR